MNDRDDLTDLTLLHYASKSGASECVGGVCEGYGILKGVYVHRWQVA